MTAAPLTTVVVPTLGRPSLDALLRALAEGTRPLDVPVLLVDDRRDPTDDLPYNDHGLDVRVLRAGGGGPARARNVGWRLARTEWVSFLDDDVVPDPDWYERLLADLSGPGPAVGGIQGNLRVPLPPGRRPTDWERCTAGLETSQWITADLTYRRGVLAAVGGFDERFRRAYREDADLGLRVTGRGRAITPGSRWVSHPVRPAGDWVSVRLQAGNADDALMRRLHGPGWRTRAGVPRGRRPRHLATTAAAGAAVMAALAGRRRTAGAAAAAWLAGTTELALARIAPGPRDRAEVRRMALTSLVIPFAASWHAARGLLRHRRAEPWQGVPELVLFDRDGTLVHDVPYNDEPGRVRPVPGAQEALDRLRRAGVRVGLVTNQSGVARGLIAPERLEAVNRRVAELLGPFDSVQVCTHAPAEGCACRKPEPGMVEAACRALGVDVGRCVVVGDIGADMEAALAAGARGVLVPNGRTRPEETAAAPHVSPDVGTAVDRLLSGAW